MLPAQLQQEWSDLRSKAVSRLRQGICSMDASEEELHQWDDIFLRFRKLREGLTAARAPSVVSCEVYELSAVVCAAARNMAELLKCLQQLVNSIYPGQRLATAAVHEQQLQHAHGLRDGSVLGAQQQQQQQQQQQSLQQLQMQMQELHLQQHTAVPYVLQAHSCSSSTSISSCTTTYKTHLMPRTCGKSSHYTSSHVADEPRQAQYTAALWQQQREEEEYMRHREVEVSAALLLYFVCIPRKPVVQEVVKQLKMAAKCSLPAVLASHKSWSSSSHSSSSGVLSSQAAKQCLCDLPATVINCHSSSIDSPAEGQQRQHKLQLLLNQPGYQLALQAAAAILNRNWVQFRRSYEQHPPLLVRIVMESALHRLNVHVVHTVVAAYRMLPSTVLEHWLGLDTKQQQQPADDDSDGWDVQLQLLEKHRTQALLLVLQSAAVGGSKGAKLALDQCTAATAALPDTLLFRA